ncbi:MAG: hypothetical protein WCX12_00110 [Candidatus Paceibacterota bacterium]|jgi:hypothetical protein
MFKKQALIIIAAIFVLMAAMPVHVSAQAVGQQRSFQIQKDVEQYQIQKLVNRTAKLNHILDPNLIHIGDTIYIPSDTNVVMYVVEPWIVNGQLAPKGCLWKIAGNYLAGNLNTKPIAVAPSRVDTVVQSTASSESDFPLLLKLLLFILLIVIIGLLFSVQNRQEEQKKQEEERRPNNGTPMIASGLSDDPTLAISQIEGVGDSLFYNPDRIVLRAERGSIHGPLESTALSASVWYREGTRMVKIPSGTKCYRVTIGSRKDTDHQHIEFWLRHCGNLVAEVASGRFELPAGWEFVPDTEGGLVVQATQTKTGEILTTLNAPGTSEGVDAGQKSDDSHNLNLTIDLEGSKLTITGTARWPRSVEVKKEEYKITF